jgi:SNF family Na+-dependent transporter
VQSSVKLSFAINMLESAMTLIFVEKVCGRKSRMRAVKAVAITTSLYQWVYCPSKASILTPEVILSTYREIQLEWIVVFLPGLMESERDGFPNPYYFGDL